jgi:large subunit ribosomal protein L35
MPKMKSHSASKKRFKLTATGKVKRKTTKARHLLEKKTAKKKRGYHKNKMVKGKFAKNLVEMIGKG